MVYYDIVSCNRFGNIVASHPEMTVPDDIETEVNGKGSLSLTVPLNDPNLDMLLPIKREIQIWREGVPYFWGPITRARDVDSRTRQIEVETPWWYLEGLHFGRAERRNWVNNGDFNNGLTGWTFVDVDRWRVQGWGAPGEYQLNLNQGGSGDDTFATQSISVPQGFWTVSAWFHIRTDSQWAGPARENRGLYVERLAADGSTVVDSQNFEISDDTEKGVFIFASVGIHQPVAGNRHLRIRLYSTRYSSASPPPGQPPGSIIWDNVKLTAEESLSYQRSDLATVVNGVISHAQSTNYQKTSLNISGGNPSTGRLIDRTWQFADHEKIADALTGLHDEGLCDYEWVYPSATSRALRLRAPRMGSNKASGVVLTLGGNCKAVPEIEIDGNRTVTSAIVLASKSDGPGRDEEAVIDTSDTDGVIREEVITSEAHYDRLRSVGRTTINSRSKLVQVPVLEVGEEMLDEVSLGDIVGFSMTDPVARDFNVRIVKINLMPKLKKARLTVNPV